ncbi:DnaJ family domain-containing protein [Micromonospora taraxaci]|uniref:DnaJ family domain-containing protein n=1 Tax=Micromonospora taraxaci TaxID=1316803 RepID=UPI0033B044BD
MTEAWEAAVEAQIRGAAQRGEFDDLPGMGKPIPGRGMPYDESWWIKSFLEREALPSDLLLPTPLQLRRRIEQIPDEVRDLPTEQSVRDVVGQLNAQIVAWLRNPDGPRVVVRPVNADEVVRRWRAEHAPPSVSTSPTERAAVVAPPRRSRRTWWPLPWRRRSR